MRPVPSPEAVKAWRPSSSLTSYRRAARASPVVPGVERKEHPDSAVGVIIENQQVAVDVGIHLEASRLSLPVDPVLIHPEADGCSRGFRVVGSRKIRPGSAEERECSKQRDHGSLRCDRPVAAAFKWTRADPPAQYPVPCHECPGGKLLVPNKLPAPRSPARCPSERTIRQAGASEQDYFRRCQYIRSSEILASLVSQKSAPRASTHSPVRRRRKTTLNSVANQGPAE